MTEETKPKKKTKKFFIGILAAVSALVGAVGYAIPDTVEIPLKIILAAVKGFLESPEHSTPE